MWFMLMAWYSLYLLYLGLPVMMETPPEKKLGYVVVTIIVTILVMVVISMIAGMFLTTAHVGGVGVGAAPRF